MVAAKCAQGAMGLGAGDEFLWVRVKCLPHAHNLRYSAPVFTPIPTPPLSLSLLLTPLPPSRPTRRPLEHRAASVLQRRWRASRRQIAAQEEAQARRSAASRITAWAHARLARRRFLAKRALAMKLQVMIEAAHVCVVTGGGQTDRCP